MAKLTDEKINEIRKSYAELGIYSQVAKLCGCSPSTVKKYCTGEYELEYATPAITFNEGIPDVADIKWSKVKEDLAKMSELSEEEFAEIKELWKEL